MCGGEGASHVEPVGLDVLDRHANEPCHLSRVRSDDDVTTFPAREPVRLSCEHVQTVCVDDKRNGGRVHQCMHECTRARSLPEPRTYGNDITGSFEQVVGCGRIQTVGRFIDRRRHVLGAHGCQDRQASRRRRHGHQACTRTEAADRGKVRCARFAERPCHQQHTTVIPLVRLRTPRDEQLAHPAPGQEFDARAIECLDDRHRNADIRNDDIASSGLRRRQHQRQLRSGQRHGGARHNRVADWLARIGRQAGRKVDGDHWNAGTVHVGCDGLEEPAQRRIQAGAEDRIDNESGASHL